MIIEYKKLCLYTAGKAYIWTSLNEKSFAVNLFLYRSFIIWTYTLTWDALVKIVFILSQLRKTRKSQLEPFQL